MNHDSTHTPLPSELLGKVHRPGEPSYESVRRIYQGRAEDAGPNIIVSCAGEEDVIAALAHARSLGTAVAVRGGGHGSDGTAMPAGGYVLDLSPMKEVVVDAESRRVSVQPGVLLGELDAAASSHGLVVPAGTVSTTGVSGLTLGGGIGHLMRRFGATVDNLISVEMVSVDGERVVADAETNPELFWALRGGGGNFGVVTRFHFQAHPFGPEVYAGQLLFPFEQAETVLAGIPRVLKSAPRELGLLATLAPAPPAPGVLEEAVGRPALVLTPVFSGDPAKGPSTVEPLAQLGQPMANLLRVMPWTAANSMLDAIAPYGLRMNLRGGYLPDLEGGAVPELIAHAEAQADSPGTTAINMWAMGGAISEDTAEEATAFSRAGAAWLWEVVHMWKNTSDDDHFAQAADSVTRSLHPYELSNGYINLSDDRGPAWREHIHGNADKQARLRRVKRAWDPGNVLRHNKNILPEDTPTATS